ncbi:MAG: hypothetical protein ACXVCE_17995 [Bacteriovorax sp.]
MKEYFRISKNRAEIIKTLGLKLTDECMLTVWQKKDDGTRSFLDRIPFCALFAKEGVFTLKVTKEKIGQINKEKEFYFLLEEHDFIFKTKMAIDQKDHVTFQVPREVRLKEFRVFERTFFTLEERKLVDVVFSVKNDMHEISLTCPLVNISKGGACILVSKETMGLIDFRSDVLLKLTNEFQTAVIRNARVFLKKNINQDELYAIGVQFQEPLP